jgi:TonB-dependent receptor
MKTDRKKFCALLIVLALGFGVPILAAASETPETGTLIGFVVDEKASPLPGAALVVVGTNLTAVTDSNGKFQIFRVPAGKITLEVNYLGFERKTVEVTIEARKIMRHDVVMDTGIGVSEEVTVVAEPLREGQAKALNQQKNAPNIIDIVSSDFIGAFPDSNSAEATQRLPGVAIQRDQGEGRYVLIRGTEARLNAMMLNGEVLPSPEGDIRNVALDVIPADLLDMIEVTKALTPDMDADSIGGAVNLITKTAPEQQRFGLGLGFGYNQISEKTLQNGSLFFGRRFNDNKLGLMLAGSYFNTDRGSHNFEVEYDDGYLDDLQNRHYTVNRKRYGLAGTLDYDFSLSTKFKLQGMWNRFDDQEYRRRFRNRVGDEELEREMKDRFETQQIWSLNGVFEHVFSNGIKLDISAAYSYANEDEPDRRDTTFLQKDVEFTPNVTPDSIDPDNIQANPLNQDYDEYEFDELAVMNNTTNEKQFVTGLNFYIPLATRTEFSSMFKAGGKLKMKTKMRDNEVYKYESEDDIPFSPFIDPNFKDSPFLDGRYDPLGSFMTINTSSQLLNNYNLESEKDLEEDLADYEADENTYALYGLAEMYFGRNLMIMPGLRYEATDIDYLGYQQVYDDEGDIEDVTEQRGTNNYGIILPHFHLRYRITSTSNFRAAFTRTLSRPNYFDIVPYRLILREDLEIEQGNPELKPTKSWNLDAMYQYYFPTVGVFSIGGFYKNLEDYIYLYRIKEEREDGTYKIIQPRNGESANLWGVEANFQRHLFAGFGLILNYTYIDSTAKFPDREGEDATLPGQSSHVGNAALTYERGMFSGRVTLNYHGKYIDQVGGDKSEDIYYDDHLQLDFRLNVRASNRVSFIAEMINLTNAPLRYYEGTEDRTIQEEYYRIWGSVGARITF